ncbi:3-oxoacyl-ACP reductase [Sphingopyxis lindanitolerans]|uniref:3-oxoacyl-ACP reductase n=1 Tax=Sphingopyxis lindanitolerans TaxID=2054227 RepID=A0A2S8B6J9_9SPHN|nr:SDR family oxidoreductase [Sphingopyxis lindanitolerans]PQM28025.1 3-oxoacyl-ACP reductase [Sphingopyxis lindanitolerans]
MAARIVLVTGAGQGVGQGIALAFAAQGDTVLLAGRTAAKLADTERLIEARGQGTAAAIECDVKSAESLNRMMADVAHRFGGLDILVNNAQEVPNGELLTVEDAAFVAGFESGPLAALRLMKLAQPMMAARGGGVILNLVSSVIERWDMTGYGAYAATKAAIRSLTRAAAAEWGKDHIRVLNIAPHAESPGLKRWADNNPDEAAAFFRTIPLGRIGACEADIGRAVVALCAPEMAYLTGATVPLDGGQANFG